MCKLCHVLRATQVLEGQERNVEFPLKGIKLWYCLQLNVGVTV